MGARRGIIWTQQARNALDEAVAYIAQDSVESALRIMEEAFELAASLNERIRSIRYEDSVVYGILKTEWPETDSGT